MGTKIAGFSELRGSETSRLSERVGGRVGWEVTWRQSGPFDVNLKSVIIVTATSFAMCPTLIEAGLSPSSWAVW